MKKIIAYYRVSTNHQGLNGYGMQAQIQQVNEYIGKNDDMELFASFREVESGKIEKREVLEAAIACCVENNAALIVSRLDRLGRCLELIIKLQRRALRFIVATNPQINELSLHILAAVAQDEGKRISERTKAGLAQAKKRGVKLGMQNPKVYNAMKKKSFYAKGAPGRAYREKNRRYIRENFHDILVGAQGKTHQQVANILNKKNYKTIQGKKFSYRTIREIRWWWKP